MYSVSVTLSVCQLELLVTFSWAFWLRHKIYSYSFLCVIWLITMCYYKPYNYVFQPNVLLQDFCRIKPPFHIYHQFYFPPFSILTFYMYKKLMKELRHEFAANWYNHCHMASIQSILGTYILNQYMISLKWIAFDVLQ